MPNSDRFRPRAIERERQIARAAAQIENTRSGPPKNRQKTSRRAIPPNTVERKREQMVQEIVARRDPAKHLLHTLGRLALVVSSLRAEPPRAPLRYR